MKSEEIKALEAKIDKSNSRLENAIIRLTDTVGGAMQTIMGVQVRAEERHANDKAFKKETKENESEIRRDIVKLQSVISECVTQEEFRPVRDDTLFNSKVVAIFGILASLTAGALIMKYFGG